MSIIVHDCVDPVCHRQVSAMLDDPDNLDWAENSVEFCGGTHLSNTSEAETFVLLEEVS